MPRLIIRSTLAVAVITATFAGAVASADALVLTGRVPMDASPADTAAKRQASLDDSWAAMNLPDTVSRPEIQFEPTASGDDGFGEFGSCVNDLGLTGWSTEGAGSGEVLTMVMDTNGKSSAPTDEQLLAFYVCAATHPTSPNGDSSTLTEEQVDWVWNYYARWLIPCLTWNRYVLADVPSAVQFRHQVAEGYLWTPYQAIEITTSNGDYDRTTERCGAERNGLHD